MCRRESLEKKLPRSEKIFQKGNCGHVCAAFNSFAYIVTSTSPANCRLKRSMNSLSFDLEKKISYYSFDYAKIYNSGRFLQNLASRRSFFSFYFSNEILIVIPPNLSLCRKIWYACSSLTASKVRCTEACLNRQLNLVKICFVSQSYAYPSFVDNRWASFVRFRKIFMRVLILVFKSHLAMA